MIGTRIAVDATMLTASVGIDRSAEWQIRGIVPIDQTPGLLIGHLGRGLKGLGRLERLERLLPKTIPEITPDILTGLTIIFFKAADGIERGASPPDSVLHDIRLYSIYLLARSFLH